MPGSLTQAKGYVTNAFAYALETPFVPENTVFGKFTFMPWVRTGLAAAQDTAAADAVRATVRIALTVTDDGPTSEPVDRTLVVRGPGDVVGIDPAQIVRRVPANGTSDAEESLLAHVEFDRPELPWLFSPYASVGDRIKPWLVLVVCDATISTEEPGPPGLPRQLRTRLGELQSLDDSWAWAHAQIVGPSDGAPSVADRLSASYGPVNLSRLLCPRKLDATKHYVAAVVPAFECGLKSALGESGGTLGPAWTRAADGSDADVEIVLPIFDSWQFSIAASGDFESLSGRLHGVMAPWNVGRRLIDASKPRGNIRDLAPADDGTLQVLRCALVSPTPMPPELPGEDSAWSVEKREELRVEIDRANAPDDDLPRVGPRMYAQYQRAQSAIGPVFGAPPASTAEADADWFAQLNTSPMHRIVAGLGTRVVQRDQEKLMQAAWAQVGDVRKANASLVRLQFGRYVGESLHRNHFSKLGLGELTQTLRGVQSKIAAAGSAITLHGMVARSAVAPAATTPAFRRLTRVRGPLARFSSVADVTALRGIVAQGLQYRDFRRPYVELDGVRSLSASAIAALPVELIARTLGVDPVVAPTTLATKLASRSTVSVADRLTQPIAGWRVPTGTVDIATRTATAITEITKLAMPTNIARSPALAESLAPLLVGVANVGIPSVSPGAAGIMAQIHAQLPFSAVPPNVGVPIGVGAPVITKPPISIGVPKAPVVPPTLGIPKTLGGPKILGGIRGVGRVAASSEVVMTRADTAVRGAVGVPTSGVRFETVVSRGLTETLAAARAVPYVDVARSLSQLAVDIGVSSLPLTPPRPALSFTRSTLLASVAPAATVTRYAGSRLGVLPGWLPKDWFADGRVAPIMAAPHFDRAMFEALEEYDRDWIIPGLGSVPFTDFVTVLETNPTFTEAFLVGLSDEMGRELLWRGFPTDRRGTYFKRFWNQGTDDLKTEIHRFGPGPLKAHLADGGEGRVVLVVRGEVVRRYPDAIFVAMRAGNNVDAEGHPVFSANPADTATHLFHHHLAPDIMLVGFDLRPSQLEPEGWWFLITENPSAPRFGLDLFEPGNLPAVGSVQRNDLDWNDLGPLFANRFLTTSAVSLTIGGDGDPPVVWPGDGGIVARTLLQNPFRAAFNAKQLITPQA